MDDSNTDGVNPQAVLAGPTELVAKVTWVDQIAPEVTLVTLRGQTLSCRTTAAIARQLAEHVGEQVRLRGTAQWDFQTLAVIAFEIEGVLPFQRVSPVEAFAALRERFGPDFDAIDDPDE